MLRCFWFTEIERLGDVGRSIENRTDGDDVADPGRLTRVGDADRVRNSAGREEKLEIDEAKADEDDEMEEEQKRPDGEIDLWKVL